MDLNQLEIKLSFLEDNMWYLEVVASGLML